MGATTCPALSGFMLLVNECKKYTGDEFTDAQVEVIRDALYRVVEGVLNAHFDECNDPMTVVTECSDLHKTFKHDSLKERN